MDRRVRLISAGMRELLKDSGVRADLTKRAERVEASARATAPVESGAYQASIGIRQDTTDRAAVLVVATADHALAVEAATGNLTRSLDAAGGR